MQALANHLLSLILFTPLAGALLILLVGSRRVDAIRWMASGCAAATFALAIPLWFRYDPHGKTWQFAERGELISAVGASYYVGVDGFSILLILLTALVAWIALVASWHEIRTGIKEFYALILTLQAGLLGVFMSLDFLQIFLFWAAALVAMHLLIRTWGEGHPPRSATRFTFYMLAASLAVLVGILALYFLNHAETGVYTFDVTQFHTLRISSAVQKWVFLAFLLGFGATLALFPLHSWLPDAQSDSPTAASLLLAAVVLKLGTYGFVRVSLPILPDASREFAPAMMVLALIAVAGGAVFAWVQRDWIRFVAYVSVSHMAFVTLGLFALTPVSVTGSMLHQINHGLATAGLLLIVAGIRQRTGVRDLALAGGLVEGDASAGHVLSPDDDGARGRAGSERLCRREDDCARRLRGQQAVGRRRRGRHGARVGVHVVAVSTDDVRTSDERVRHKLWRPDAARASHVRSPRGALALDWSSSGTVRRHARNFDGPRRRARQS